MLQMHLLNVGDHTGYTPYEKNNLSSQFKWLDNCILYFPMWSRLSPYGKRNKYLSSFMLIITLIFNIVYCGGNFWLIMSSNYNITVMIVYSTKVSIDILSKLCSMYYFWKIFNFPWRKCIRNFAPTHEEKLQSMIRFYGNITLAMVLIVAILRIVGDITHDLSTTESTNYTIISLTLAMIGMYSVYIPMNIVIATHSAICLKGCKYLHELQHIVTANTIKEVYIKYELLYNTIKRDRNQYLQKSIELFLIATILELWVGVYLEVHYNIFDLICNMHDMVVFLLYVTTASCLSEQFYKFEE
eukprot:513458_1